MAEVTKYFQDKPREAEIVRLNKYGRELIGADNPDRVGVVRNVTGTSRNSVLVEWGESGELENWNVFYLDWEK